MAHPHRLPGPRTTRLLTDVVAISGALGSPGAPEQVGGVDSDCAWPPGGARYAELPVPTVGRPRWVEDALLDVLDREGVGCIDFTALAQGQDEHAVEGGVDLWRAQSEHQV